MTTAPRRSGGVPPGRAAVASFGAAVAAIGAALCVAACAPTFDWREARPDGSGVAMLFPCRPERRERPVRLADSAVVVRLDACGAGGTTFGLAAVDAADPTRVRPLLEALRAQAVANIAGAARIEAPAAVPGATPNPLAERLRIVGRGPDGAAVVEHALFFVKGTTVFQATTLGAVEPADRDTVDTFFGSIRLP